MGIFEILLIIGLSIFVISVIIKSIIDKKRGKCSCDCDGSCCSSCKKLKEISKNLKSYIKL